MSESAVPSTHTWHDVCASPAYVPLPHAVQGVDGIESSSALPAVQFAHVVPFPPAYD
eukprot:COSAG01_NODE_12882_length_1670_cov_162.216423_1_plen_56_part_10